MRLQISKLSPGILGLLIGFILTGGVAAHVDLDYPVGGEVFTVGEEVMISWTEIVNHGPSNWDLYFSSDAGASWTPLVENLAMTELSWVWTISEAVTVEGRIRVVQDNSEFITYESDSGNFTIEEIDVPALSAGAIALLLILPLAAVVIRRIRQPFMIKSP